MNTNEEKSVNRIEAATCAELRDEGIALLQLMKQAEQDIAAGRTYFSDETLERLRRQFFATGEHKGAQ